MWSANGEDAIEVAMSCESQGEKIAFNRMWIPPDGPEEDKPESFLLFLFLLLIGMKAEEGRPLDITKTDVYTIMNHTSTLPHREFTRKIAVDSYSFWHARSCIWHLCALTIPDLAGYPVAHR
jgi:hypothetical protein